LAIVAERQLRKIFANGNPGGDRLMPTLTRRHLLAGAAATAACAAMPAAAAIEAAAEAPIVMMGGSQFFYGTFGPENFGADGDTFIDIITDDVWQKASGAWRLVANVGDRGKA
jgi:hypothetical protein